MSTGNGSTRDAGIAESQRYAREIGDIAHRFEVCCDRAAGERTPVWVVARFAPAEGALDYIRRETQRGGRLSVAGRAMLYVREVREGARWAW